MVPFGPYPYPVGAGAGFEGIKLYSPTDVAGGVYAELRVVDALLEAPVELEEGLYGAAIFFNEIAEGAVEEFGTKFPLLSVIPKALAPEES